LDGLDSSSKDYSGGLRFLLSAKGGGVFVIKGLPVLNNVMLKKLAWHMVIEDSMIFIYLHARYFIQNHIPWTWYISSSVWPGLKPLYVSLTLESRWLVGRHYKVHFWTDN